MKPGVSGLEVQVRDYGGSDQAVGEERSGQFLDVFGETKRFLDSLDMKQHIKRVANSLQGLF